jgi:LmbE family N-acetylglucosaminyl deacetylase
LPNVPQRALVISAHPDDLDFGCSGTVALWNRAGTAVTYVICTDGSKGSDDPSLSPEEIAATRQREQMAAARVVGVNAVDFLGFPDGELENSAELRRRLVETIRRVRPDVVVCQDPANRAFENFYVSHRDHRAAAEAAFDAVYPASGSPLFFPELATGGLPPHRVHSMMFFGTHAPNHWQDISSVMDLKLQAIFSHRSQLGHRGDLEQFVRDRFRDAGKAAGYEYAEPFRRAEVPP